MSDQRPVASDFSSKQAIEIVGITYRRLDYWTRTGLVVSTAQEAEGSGSRRRYSYNDLLELKLIKRLLDEGIGLQRVREVFDYLRDELGEDVVSADLVINGSQSLLVRTDEQLLDALRQGQGALYLRTGELAEEVDAAVRQLPVEEDSSQDAGSQVAGPQVAESQVAESQVAASERAGERSGDFSRYQTGS